MHFIDPPGRAPAHRRPRRPALAQRLLRLKSVVVAALLAACSSPMPPYRPAPPPAKPPERGPAAAPEPASTSEARSERLGPPRKAASWQDFRRQAAERLVAASPGRTYRGEVPEVLLAIPVLEVELNGDGSVRRVVVLRHPKQATDTTQLAIDAVHRAAPYGAVSHLPRPWKFAETFLFNDARHFKPRTLDD